MSRENLTSNANRPLRDDEIRLIRWMLEHGVAGATVFLQQLERAEVTSWRCPCGCASLDFQIEGHPHTRHRIHILAEFVFGDDDDLKGIFVFECGGVLSGVEVIGDGGDPPKVLPVPEVLETAEHYNQRVRGK